MRTLWMARHGNRYDFADPNWADTADRPHDPGLAPDGVEQSRKLGERLKDAPVDRIIASPFLRTVQTAHHVAEVTEHDVYLEPGLSEWRNPDWYATAPTLLPARRLQDLFPCVRLGHDACRAAAYPETKADALARIGDAGRCLVDRYPGETLFLVGHGITVQGVLEGFLGTIPNDGCPLASLTKLVRDDQGWRLAFRNDVEHLGGDARAADRLA